MDGQYTTDAANLIERFKDQFSERLIWDSMSAEILIELIKKEGMRDEKRILQ